MKRHTSVQAMIDGIRKVMRVREYSLRTEEAYLRWIERFLRYHRAPHWRSLDREHVDRFLEHLARDAGVSAATRNQAASALAFLYREILGSDVMEQVTRARGPSRVKCVLSHTEAMAIVDELAGQYRLLGSLMYGSGLRVREAVSLRLKDVDFELGQITVRRGKGEKDRIVPLPHQVRSSTWSRMRSVAEQHRLDLANGQGWVRLPGAMDRKDPKAGYELKWQFLFPASRVSRDPTTGRWGRWHVHESALQRKVKKAVRAAGILKRASSHTLRHSFATEMLRSGVDVETVRKMMGHKDLKTTQLYLHAIEEIGLAVRSPLDRPVSRRPTTPTDQLSCPDLNKTRD